MSDIDYDCWHEVFMVCPYCKHQHTDDLHEYFPRFEDDETDNIQCDSCDKYFKAQIHIDVKYSTYKVGESE